MYRFTFLIGVLLLISPILFGFNMYSIESITFVVIGGIVLLTSIFESRVQDVDAWGYSLTEIIGLIAILAPYALGFAEQTTITLMLIFSGFLLIVTSGVKQHSGRLHY